MKDLWTCVEDEPGPWIHKILKRQPFVVRLENGVEARAYPEYSGFRNPKTGQLIGVYFKQWRPDTSFMLENYSPSDWDEITLNQRLVHADWFRVPVAFWRPLQSHESE